jgi:Family of unknown function (DUF6152)
MTKMIMAVCATTLVMLVTASSLPAHHVLAQFDTATPVTVRGTVVLFQRINPHSLLVLDEKRETGKIRRWIIEGPSALQLTRNTIEKDALKAGDIVEVCGYVMKPGLDSQRTIFSEPPDLHLKTPAQVSVTGQNMDGELVVMPDGQKRVWSDYGHHKCLPAGYIDSHTK